MSETPPIHTEEETLAENVPEATNNQSQAQGERVPLATDEFVEAIAKYETAQHFMKIALQGCGFPLEYLTAKFVDRERGPALLIDFNYEKIGINLDMAHFKFHQAKLSNDSDSFYALRTHGQGTNRVSEVFGLVQIPLFKSDSQPEPNRFFKGKSDQEMLDTLLEKYSPTRLDEIRKYIVAILTKAQGAILAQSTSV